MAGNIYGRTLAVKEEDSPEGPIGILLKVVHIRNSNRSNEKVLTRFLLPEAEPGEAGAAAAILGAAMLEGGSERRRLYVTGSKAKTIQRVLKRFHSRPLQGLSDFPDTLRPLALHAVRYLPLFQINHHYSPLEHRIKVSPVGLTDFNQECRSRWTYLLSQVGSLYWAADASRSTDATGFAAFSRCTEDGDLFGPVLTIPLDNVSAAEAEMVAGLAAYRVGKAMGEQSPVIYSDYKDFKRAVCRGKSRSQPVELLKAGFEKEELKALDIRWRPRNSTPALKEVDRQARKEQAHAVEILEVLEVFERISSKFSYVSNKELPRIQAHPRWMRELFQGLDFPVRFTQNSVRDVSKLTLGGNLTSDNCYQLRPIFEDLEWQLPKVLSTWDGSSGRHFLEDSQRGWIWVLIHDEERGPRIVKVLSSRDEIREDHEIFP